MLQVGLTFIAQQTCHKLTSCENFGVVYYLHVSISTELFGSGVVITHCVIGLISQIREIGHWKNNWEQFVYSCMCIPVINSNMKHWRFLGFLLQWNCMQCCYSKFLLQNRSAPLIPGPWKRSPRPELSTSSIDVKYYVHVCIMMKYFHLIHKNHELSWLYRNGIN